MRSLTSGQCVAVGVAGAAVAVVGTTWCLGWAEEVLVWKEAGAEGEAERLALV